MNKKQAKEITGGLSAPGKMPEGSYNLPASMCQTGAKLREIEGTPCWGCYAFKGRYNFPNVKDALTRRLESIQDPQWVQANRRQLCWRRVTNFYCEFFHLSWP